MAHNKFKFDIEYAYDQDRNDPLKTYRAQFLFPKMASGQPKLYFNGNSLGLQPKGVKSVIDRELKHWADFGVKGHFSGPNPWIPYHQKLASPMAKIVGANPEEVVIMNTLTVNLHLMMVTFFRPQGKRTKVIMESDAFPSDRFAVESQMKHHGFNPDTEIIYATPRPVEQLLRQEDLENLIDQYADQLAMVLIGVPNYYTGQVIDMKQTVRKAHQVGARIGFNLAHAAGNIPLNLHEDGPDFAVWCTYKYLNAGPGNLSGCFIHERHAHNKALPRFAGWWGQHPEKRFKMRMDFDPAPGADGWNLSNAPIFQLAALEGSLKLFEEAGMEALRKKSLQLTSYLEYLLYQLPHDQFEIITPSNPSARGCQLSIRIKNSSPDLYEKLTNRGIVTDWRDPDVIRAAPVPLYNTYLEVFEFVRNLREILGLL